jgi:hypothetical protein
MALSFDHKLALAIMVVVVVTAGMAYFLLVPRGPVVTDADRARYACIFLCKAARGEGMYLGDGPCLSTGTAWEMEDWVCDVAHWPREEVDNLPENQCPDYGVSASHFVEVSPECGFIRAV